jgi:hypothetical protein
MYVIVRFVLLDWVSCDVHGCSLSPYFRLTR